VFGVPRQRPVYDRLYDLYKLYGGSAEMYWRGAFPGLSLETHPQLGGDVTVDAAATRTQMEQYMNGLQRYLLNTGISAKSLAPQVVDPSKQIEIQLDAICIQLKVPKRIFLGSERGELASTQDSKAWNNRLMSRQNGYITPRIIVPFIDRLITFGVLPEPQGYSIVWEDLNSLTEEQQSIIAKNRIEAIAKYVASSGAETLVPPQFFLTDMLGFTDQQATAMLEEGEKLQAEEDALAAEEEQLMLEQGLLPDGTPVDGDPMGNDPTNSDPANPFPPKPPKQVPPNLQGASKDDED